MAEFPTNCNELQRRTEITEIAEISTLCMLDVSRESICNWSSGKENIQESTKRNLFHFLKQDDCNQYHLLMFLEIKEHFFKSQKHVTKHWIVLTVLN